MLLYLLGVAAGLALLTKGATWFVDGSVALARMLLIPPYVIGATLVAVGTSLPEVFTSGYAAFTGSSEIALANVVGSNLANVGLVFGIAAVVSPVLLDRDVFTKDSPHFIFSIGFLGILGADGVVDRVDALFLLGLLVVYTVGLLVDKEALEPDESLEAVMTQRQITLRLAAGILGFVVGARFLVEGASGIARLAGLPEWIIGLTLVAFGTSLPEMATSVAAAYRGHSGIAVGNVVGSNILNIYLVVGLAALVTPVAITTSTLVFDLPALFVMGICFMLMLNGGRATRDHGWAMILAYSAVIYTSLHLHRAG